MNKVIVITGASSGMGKDFAMRMLDRGHQVFGLARRAERMQDIVKAGGHAIATDITDTAQIKAAIEQILAQADSIDVLINNAGFPVYGPVEEVSIADARRQFEVNIFGLATITQQVLPLMREQRAGTIINISSMGGKMYTPLGAWYHATKHALEGWSDCLRLELADFGIKVVIVEPGGIKTEFTDVFKNNFFGDQEKGPYAGFMRGVMASYEQSLERNQLSEVSVITDLIDKAVHSNKPKTRYVAGAYAKPLMWIRKHFGDRFFDRLLLSQIKQPATPESAAAQPKTSA